MTYRCPYCRNLIEGEPQPTCQSCGKIMVVPKMRDSSPRTMRHRAIDNIWREAEQKKAEMPGVVPPSIVKSPRFYFGIVLALVVVGVALNSAVDKTVTRTSPELRTLRNLDVLAEALGRYHAHTGTYPTTHQGGLGALVRDPGPVLAPGWNGPYISHLRADPWDIPYVYEPPERQGDLPTLFSCGPDREPNTPDDLKPNPECFDPGTDWTNGWLRVEERWRPGVTIGNP